MALPDTLLQPESIASSYSSYMALKDTQKSVLIAVIDDFMSEDIHTDEEIADIAGVNRKTVYNCKRNQSFVRALTEIMPALVKAKLPKYLTMIEKHGEKDYKAIELILRFAGLYVPASQQMNIHANRNSQQSSMSLEDTLSGICQRMIELGYTEERFIDHITQVFRTVKIQGIA